MSADTAAKRFSAMNLMCPWRGPHVVPDVTIPAGERQTLLYLYSGITGIVLTAAFYGSPFLFTAANWKTSIPVYLEVYMRATTGTVYAELYDLTAAAIVAGTALSTASATFTRIRASSVALTDGHSYQIQISKYGSDAGEILSGKLILIN